jgi:2Fe-2S ferredoxin
MSDIQLEVVDRKGVNHSLSAASGTVLMHVLKTAGLPIAATCSGAKSCATCHVFVREGYQRVGEPDEDEIDLLYESDHYNESMSRLSCQIELVQELSGLQIELAPQN